MYLFEPDSPRLVDSHSRVAEEIDSETPEGTPVAAPDRGMPDDPRSAWPGLVARIRRSAADAESEFARMCRPGVHLLMKLNLSPIGLDSLVDETLAGAVREIRGGWLREPRHLAAFVRSVIDRHASPESRPGASDQARARARAAEVERILRQFPPVERTWLLRFYAEGWSIERIVSESGMTVDEFLELRRKMRERAGLYVSRPAPVLLRRVRAAGA